MNSQQKITRVLGNLLLAVALAGSVACASNSTVARPNSLGPGVTGASLAPAIGAPAVSADVPAVDRAASAAAVQAVEKALPQLRGVAPDDQLRTLRWMLSVGDDSRLVFLFDDLRDARDEPLERRAATARQRLEELAGDLERAGHRAPEPDAEVARIDPNAPAPNYFPPSMIQDLERRKNADPEAARALEEILRTSPRGSRPPGR
jgi:hypothetical protein